MTDRVYIVSRTLEDKIAIAENNDQNVLFVTIGVLKEILALLKEQEEKICSAKEIAMDESTNATWREDSEAWEVLDRIVQKLS